MTLPKLLLVSELFSRLHHNLQMKKQFLVCSLAKYKSKKQCIIFKSKATWFWKYFYKTLKQNV